MKPASAPLSGCLVPKQNAKPSLFISVTKNSKAFLRVLNSEISVLEQAACLVYVFQKPFRLTISAYIEVQIQKNQNRI